MVKRGRSRTSRLHPLSRATVLHGRCGLGAQNFGGVVRVPQGYALSCYPMYVYNTGNIEQGPKPYVIVKRQSVESHLLQRCHRCPLLSMGSMAGCKFLLCLESIVS